MTIALVQRLRRIASGEWTLKGDEGYLVVAANMLERECWDADKITAALGLTIEQSRTEGGSLHVPRIVATIATLRRDAERYRWLKKMGYDRLDLMLAEFCGDEWDAAIDAALATEEPKAEK